MRPPVVLLAFVVLVLPGCFGEEPAPAVRQVSASGGKVSDGWAYDGAGLGSGGATLEGTLDQEKDAGLVTAMFEHAGSRWEVTFDRFAESKPFMAGGVVFDLVEHGDSGVADASIPRIHAVAAAWGTATVTRDGVPVVGAAGDQWSAHLMASRDTVRGADGKIAKADGAAPYDPAAPADARRIENDPQAFLVLRHPDGETFRRAPVSGSQPVVFQGSTATQHAEVPVEPGAASALVNVSVGPGAAPVGAGQIRIVVRDAEGNEVGSAPQSNVLPGQPYVASFAIPRQGLSGALSVEVTGTGTYTATVDHLVTYDDRPFLVVTWDDPTVV